jgi:hypothetical protein
LIKSTKSVELDNYTEKTNRLVEEVQWAIDTLSSCDMPGVVQLANGRLQALRTHLTTPCSNFCSVCRKERHEVDCLLSNGRSAICRKCVEDLVGTLRLMDKPYIEADPDEDNAFPDNGLELYDGE